MSSVREQILAKIVELLTPVAGVESRVYRSRVNALQKSELPAILVEPVSDQAGYTQMDNLSWVLKVRVGLILRSETPESDMDPILVSIHSLLMATRDVGGLAMDIIPESVTFSNLKDDVTTGTADAIYSVSYRTAATDLEVST